VDGAYRFLGAEDVDRALDRAPSAEVYEITEAPAAFRPHRRLRRRLRSELEDKGRRFGQGRAIGKVQMVAQHVLAQVRWNDPSYRHCLSICRILIMNGPFT
jgi:hypothetical protein